jgi:outer membrane murein-binding lipoprotein Lpp
MFNQLSKANFRLKMSLFGLCLASAVVAAGCSVSAKNNDAPAAVQTKASEEKNNPEPNAAVKNSYRKGRIEIKANSPADAVRTFYKNLRERRFREAMLMTNVRPAIEGLSEAEMQDLSVDFEPLAKQVPAEIQINGEILTGNTATVTAKMPHEDTGVPEDKVFNLRREGEGWIILTADEKSEAQVKKEGKNYFFNIRVEIHQVEAQMMLERIVKAQAIYSLRNAGGFGEMQTLIEQGLLAPDAQTTDSTGYRYTVSLSADKKKYFVTAEPAVYGKTGKFSYLVEVEGADKPSRFKSQDKKGQPLKK